MPTVASYLPPAVRWRFGCWPGRSPVLVPDSAPVGGDGRQQGRAQQLADSAQSGGFALRQGNEPVGGDGARPVVGAFARGRCHTQKSIAG